MDEKLTDKERLETGQLLVKAIIEMFGAPKEHLDNTLKEYVEKLKEHKDYTIIKSDLAEAQPQPNSKLFSNFVELEIWFNDSKVLLDFCFDSMPASVEITRPEENLVLNSTVFSNLLNDLQTKIHNFDLLVKSVRAQNKILDQNATKVLRNFISYLVTLRNVGIDEISKHLGIKPKELKPFLDRLIREGFIEEKEEKYSLKKK